MSIDRSTSKENIMSTNNSDTDTAARKLRYSRYVLSVVRREVGARTDADMLRRVYALVEGARRREAGTILGFGAGFAVGVVYILASLWLLA